MIYCAATQDSLMSIEYYYMNEVICIQIRKAQLLQLLLVVNLN